MAATAVLAGVTPDSLLAQLPADLRPGKVSFYYDPYTEGQRLQQAALQQTGQASFVSGLAWDSQNQLSVTDQEKLSLYKNAADYAKAHNIALGTALTQTQVNELDKPLLWYVQQAVPDPNCNTVASTACPTVNALVPQVYLPEGYAQALTKPTGGTIAGDKVSLDIAGQLRNSGAITAADTLNVKAGSIDAGPNVVDIGTSAYKAQGGWNVITGTVVQPGGFMSAMRMNIEADSIHAVNNAFLIRNADGTVDEAATVALVNQLKANLGLNYTEGTVADDIHTRFIKEKKGGFGPIGMVVAMVAAVAISIVTAGAGAAIVGAAYSAVMGATAAAGAAFATAGIGAAMSLAVSGLIAGTLSSMASQLITTGSLNMGAALKAGVVSGVTAGLTQGALGGLDLGDVGIKNIGENLAKGTWDAVQSNLGGYVTASVVRSAISAGVNTVAYGGSFGQAFANGLVRDAAAVGANAIGVTLPGIGTVGADTSTILANAASHALLGCAAASLSGGDCAGGAVGGAASAIAAPLIRDGLYAGSQTVIDNGDGTRTVKYENTGYNAATVALATLIGGSAGALLGTNATAAALAAQNEALNNSTSDKVVKWVKETYQDPLGDLARWGKEFLGMLPGQTPPTEANPLVDVTNGGNPPATGGAVVTPPLAACTPGGPCVMTPPIASPGVPGNAILSSGNSESGSGGGSGNSTSGLPTTDAVSVSGSRSIDKAQSYENAVRGMYNNTPFAERQYAAVVNGQRVSGVADDVAILNGKLTAVEAKYADDWSTSLRNPSSPNGMTPWARAEQQNMFTQAQKYASGFDGGVVYHTNSPQLAAYYSQVFRNAGVKNFKFVITPTK